MKISSDTLSVQISGAAEPCRKHGGLVVDLSTNDHRAWTLAPHLVVVGASAGSVEWMNPETGTTCQVDPTGEYVVLRRVNERVTPVVAGQILPDEAVALFKDPESVEARRAAAHAIVAVDETVRD
jgi:hypothetical protein